MAVDFFPITRAASIENFLLESRPPGVATALTHHGARPCQAPISRISTSTLWSMTWQLCDFLRQKVGAEHLMLGTDFPYVLGDWMGVDKIEALPCSEREKQVILEGNAKKLLKISAS